MSVFFPAPLSPSTLNDFVTMMARQDNIHNGEEPLWKCVLLRWGKNKVAQFVIRFSTALYHTIYCRACQPRNSERRVKAMLSELFSLDEVASD